jgi:hypothetical protein
MTVGVDREPATLLFCCNICGKPSLTDVLRNKTRTGVVQEFNDLVFHGDPGATLEMRVFSEIALVQHLKDAGFANIKVHRAVDLVHGIWWPEPWAFPMSARKPKAC